MKTAKPAPAKSAREAGGAPQPEGLPVRQLKLVGVAALLFGIISALVMSWELIFPVPPEQLVEVAWTHECGCARGWMKSLREEGFVVRDHEMENLSATRRQWQVPDAVHGCHPATYMGYVLDGHVPPDTLRRLAREHPTAAGLIQVDAADITDDDGTPTEDLQFELIDRDGVRRPWS